MQLNSTGFTFLFCSGARLNDARIDDQWRQPLPKAGRAAWRPCCRQPISQTRSVWPTPYRSSNRQRWGRWTTDGETAANPAQWLRFRTHLSVTSQKTGNNSVSKQQRGTTVTNSLKQLYWRVRHDRGGDREIRWLLHPHPQRRWWILRSNRWCQPLHLFKTFRKTCPSKSRHL